MQFITSKFGRAGRAAPMDKISVTLSISGDPKQATKKGEEEGSLAEGFLTHHTPQPSDIDKAVLVDVLRDQGDAFKIASAGAGCVTTPQRHLQEPCQAQGEQHSVGDLPAVPLAWLKQAGAEHFIQHAVGWRHGGSSSSSGSYEDGDALTGSPGLLQLSAPNHGGGTAINGQACETVCGPPGGTLSGLLVPEGSTVHQELRAGNTEQPDASPSSVSTHLASQSMAKLHASIPTDAAIHMAASSAGSSLRVLHKNAAAQQPEAELSVTGSHTTHAVCAKADLDAESPEATAAVTQERIPSLLFEDEDRQSNSMAPQGSSIPKAVYQEAAQQLAALKAAKDFMQQSSIVAKVAAQGVTSGFVRGAVANLTRQAALLASQQTQPVGTDSAPHRTTSRLTPQQVQFLAIHQQETISTRPAVGVHFPTLTEAAEQALTHLKLDTEVQALRQQEQRPTRRLEGDLSSQTDYEAGQEHLASSRRQGSVAQTSAALNAMEQKAFHEYEVVTAQAHACMTGRKKHVIVLGSSPCKQAHPDCKAELEFQKASHKGTKEIITGIPGRADSISLSASSEASNPSLILSMTPCSSRGSQAVISPMSEEQQSTTKPLGNVVPCHAAALTPVDLCLVKNRPDFSSSNSGRVDSSTRQTSADDALVVDGSCLVTGASPGRTMEQVEAEAATWKRRANMERNMAANKYSCEKSDSAINTPAPSTLLVQAAISGTPTHRALDSAAEANAGKQARLLAEALISTFRNAPSLSSTSTLSTGQGQGFGATFPENGLPTPYLGQAMYDNGKPLSGSFTPLQQAGGNNYSSSAFYVNQVQERETVISESRMPSPAMGNKWDKPAGMTPSDFACVEHISVSSNYTFTTSHGTQALGSLHTAQAPGMQGRGDAQRLATGAMCGHAVGDYRASGNSSMSGTASALFGVQDVAPADFKGYASQPSSANGARHAGYHGQPGPVLSPPAPLKFAMTEKGKADRLFIEAEKEVARGQNPRPNPQVHKQSAQAPQVRAQPGFDHSGGVLPMPPLASGPSYPSQSSRSQGMMGGAGAAFQNQPVSNMQQPTYQPPMVNPQPQQTYEQLLTTHQRQRQQLFAQQQMQQQQMQQMYQQPTQLTHQLQPPLVQLAVPQQHAPQGWELPASGPGLITMHSGFLNPARILPQHLQPQSRGQSVQQVWNSTGSVQMQGPKSGQYPSHGREAPMANHFPWYS